jgi:hypothetical protein
MRPCRALTLAVIATAACSSEAPTPTESDTPAHPTTPASLGSGIVFGMFGFARPIGPQEPDRTRSTRGAPSQIGTLPTPKISYKSLRTRG